MEQQKRKLALNGSPIFEQDEVFRFSCHAGLPCFNSCCRDISIFLSPYDVIRIKNKLGLTSGEFLSTYTERLTTRGGLHLARLKMREDDDLKCYFVTEKGCAIYSERPWSCRMAPIDMNSRGEYHFIFNDSQCIGLKETPEWTVNSWMRDQDMLIYEELEALVRELPSRLEFTGLRSLDRHLAELQYMVSYDVDRFRRFIFETNFRETYPISGETAAQLRTDDVELMKYGLAWLSGGVDLRKTIEFRDQLDQNIAS